MNVNTLNRMVAAAIISAGLLVGMCIPTNGQQPPQQPATQLQPMPRDPLPREAQPQLARYRQHVDQGQRAKPQNASLKKSSFLILKSVGRHIKPLPSVSIEMPSWQNRW